MRLVAAGILAILSLPLVVAAAINPSPENALMVIANADTPALNEATLQRVYLGKVIEVDGRPILPANLPKGNGLRKVFMEQVLTQEDEKFIAYWTVRRYIGQGTPPREFRTVEEQLEFVRTTPGAVGYVPATTDIKAGLRVLLKKP